MASDVSAATGPLPTPPVPDSADTAASWRFASIAARLIVGALFIATAAGKIGDPLGFAEEIQDYQLAPIAITHAMALILPWLEGLAGVLLIAGVWRCEARLLIAAMLVVFTAAKAYGYFALDMTGPCGCGGDFVLLSTIFDNPQGLFTNGALLALLGIDALAERRTARADSAAR